MCGLEGAEGDSETWVDAGRLDADWYISISTPEPWPSQDQFRNSVSALVILSPLCITWKESLGKPYQLQIHYQISGH